MSYWETLLVILRRWRISIPAVLVAVGVGAGAFVVSPPQYEDTTQVLFIGSPNQPGEKALVNPYLGLGSALVQTAAVIQATISTPQVADTLYKQGATGLYVVSADLSTPAPVLLLTSTAKSPEIARTTTDAVVDAMKAELLAVQRQAGAPPSQYVNLTIISALPKPERKLNASLRPAIVAGAGVLALAMFALFLLEGRRQRKSRPADERQSSAGAPGPQPPVDPFGLPSGQRYGYPDEQPVGQYAAMQHQNGQNANGQNANGQNANGQYASGQYASGQYPNGQYPNGQYPGVEHPNGQPAQPVAQPVARQAPQPARQPRQPQPPAAPGRGVPTLLPAHAQQPTGSRDPREPREPVGDPVNPRGVPARPQPQRPRGVRQGGPSMRTPPAGNALPRRGAAGQEQRNASWFDGLEEERARRANRNGIPARDADGHPPRT